jgi:hypothetical protein
MPDEIKAPCPVCKALNTEVVRTHDSGTGTDSLLWFCRACDAAMPPATWAKYSRPTPAPVEGWREISTAPEGQGVLHMIDLWHRSGIRIADAYRQGNQWRKNMAYYDADEITHWMKPLPPPPKGAEK